MIADYVKLSVKSLRSRGLRSWLTMLGIFVGIAAVVSLISLGQGLQNYINDEFEKVGVNRIIVTPGGGSGGIVGAGTSQLSSAKLTDDDLDTVLDVREVETGTGMYRKSEYINYKGETHPAYLFGIEYSGESLDYVKTLDFMELRDGRYPSPTEDYTAVIGGPLADDGFDEPLEKGVEVSVKGKTFEIVGVNKKTGQPPQDQKLSIPLDVMREMYGAGDELSMISVQVSETANVSEVAEEVERRLRRSRDVEEGEEDFTVQTAEQLLASFQSIIGVVQVVLGGIAAISLIVGGLGIMTTMYTSVLERTKQIGIMKAVGARNENILTLFLVESGILGMAGGMIGVLLGLSISFGASYIAQEYYGSDLLKASAEPQLIFGALAFSFIVGCVSGVFPSLKAARMRPVDAIRSQ